MRLLLRIQAEERGSGSQSCIQKIDKADGSVRAINRSCIPRESGVCGLLCCDAMITQ